MQEDTLTDGKLIRHFRGGCTGRFYADEKKYGETGNWRHSSDIEEMLKAFAARVETLTPAELMVLQYYVDGYTIQEIAFIPLH